MNYIIGTARQKLRLLFPNSRFTLLDNISPRQVRRLVIYLYYRYKYISFERIAKLSKKSASQPLRKIISHALNIHRWIYIPFHIRLPFLFLFFFSDPLTHARTISHVISRKTQKKRKYNPPYHVSNCINLIFFTKPKEDIFLPQLRIHIKTDDHPETFLASTPSRF